MAARGRTQRKLPKEQAERAGGESQAARDREETGPRWPVSTDDSGHSGRRLFLSEPEIDPTLTRKGRGLRHHRLKGRRGLYLGH